MNNQELFDYLSTEHNLTLLENELDEIVSIVKNNNTSPQNTMVNDYLVGTIIQTDNIYSGDDLQMFHVEQEFKKELFDLMKKYKVVKVDVCIDAFRYLAANEVE